MKIINKIFDFSWRIFLSVIIICCLVLSGIAVYKYYSTFSSQPISNQAVSWGVFGDYFGGTLNPLLALINICITIWLTILVNKYASQNSDREIKANKTIAKIQLRSDAMRDFRSSLNEKFEIWGKDVINKDKAKECGLVLNSFATNYTYLFDLNRTGYNQIKRMIITIIAAIEANPNNLYLLQDFAQANMARQALIAELGEMILNEE